MAWLIGAYGAYGTYRTYGAYCTKHAEKFSKAP